MLRNWAFVAFKFSDVSLSVFYQFVNNYFTYCLFLVRFYGFTSISRIFDQTNRIPETERGMHPSPHEPTPRPDFLRLTS